ncbi:hypothetical protein CBS101457_000571 [Exobasidium rhododendri]|nr:hypothetical protein CBS101457_000571 [Exobasidium rhododendri]
MLRHGVASVDPRFEYNRSFHQLSGRIKALRIDYDGMARESKGVATATCRWGQDQLSENREDGAGDEALADMSDRLAYIFSLIGDLHVEHSRKIEDSRVDLKRIQKAESELAPKRAARVKIHKELMALVPERAKVNSSKIAPLEAQLQNLEADDKASEEDLGKLKREALKSSYDAHFDSMIELGEKMALLARYGKLMTTQLPVYAPPFPTPRNLNRGPDDETWPGEANLAAIRAAVEPALILFKPDFSLPEMPQVSTIAPLSKRQTIRFSESHRQEIEKASKEDEEKMATLDSQESTLQTNLSHDQHSSPSALPMGGSLPPNLNFEPSPLPAKSVLGHTPPPLPPRDIHHRESVSSPAYDTPRSNLASASVESGPTLAETGSPIMSSSQGPGPLTGTLSPRRKISSATASSTTVPAIHDASSDKDSTYSTSKSKEAEQERLARVQTEVAHVTAATRIRRDGTVVRPSDPDWNEDLPTYHE